MSRILSSSVRLTGLFSTLKRLLQLLQQLALPLAELGRRLHLQLDVQVAATAAIQLRHAFVPES